MQALHLHVEEALGVDPDAERPADLIGQRLFGLALDGEEALPRREVVRGGLELAQAVEIPDPALADALRDERREPRVAEAQPPPRRDAVGLVVEPLGEEVVEVGEHAGLEEARVDLGDAVDGV